MVLLLSPVAPAAVAATNYTDAATNAAIAVAADVRTWLDVSLRRFETVFPACGSDNSAIELTPAQLEAVAQNCRGWVDVCKDWDPDLR